MVTSSIEDHLQLRSLLLYVLGKFVTLRICICQEVNIIFVFSRVIIKLICIIIGNHESKNLNKMYGFENEVKHKYCIKTYDLFSDMFCNLPIAHCINRKILVLHGGLFAKDGVTLEDI